MVKVIKTSNLSKSYDEPRALSIFTTIEDTFTDGWSEDLSNNVDAYNKVALVRACINLIAHFGTQKSFRTFIEPKDNIAETVKKFIDDVNTRVNLDNIIYTSIIRREIDGRAAHEMIKDNKGIFTSMIPLIGSRIKPKVDEKTWEVTKFEYQGARGGEYDVEDIFYVTLNSLDVKQLGKSSIDAIRTVLKLKRNIEKDLLEASKRLWAPVGIFELDTSMIVDPTKKAEAITHFKEKIKPGQSLVHNQKVKANIMDLKPDINGLVKAIEKADEEIMGNWGIPKALLSREKTLTKSTLEFSLKALWEGPIASVQRYYKGQLEAQWYPRVLASAKKGWENKYMVRHVFNPIAVFDPQMIMSLAKAVDAEIISKEDFFRIVGWEPEIMEEGTVQPGTSPYLPKPGEEPEEEGGV